MEISVFGLGYVGAVSSACLSNDGHSVIGVDNNLQKVALINEGKSPIIEPGLEEMISSGVSNGLLKATTDVHFAVNNTSISFICVGTPSQLNGSLDLKYVRTVCEQIGECIKDKSDYHVVVIRSTMLPGTMENVVLAILEEKSAKKVGVDFGLCINPEFLRESTAVYDYYNPPKTVIGQSDVKSGVLVQEIFEKLEAPLILTDLQTAEMVKYSDNVWHAVKVTFANEIGNICKSLDIDSHKVMDIFCKDTKLNISPYYMKPGFAFGGSCLPKDLRALTYKAKALDVNIPMLDSVLTSNESQINNGIERIKSFQRKNIAFLGFSFKAGTDDLRESPIVTVIETLLGKGYNIKLYDRNVNLALLTGANKDYILNAIPHISKLMVSDIQEAISHAELVVVGTKEQEFVEVVEQIKGVKPIFDLVRLLDEKSEEGVYDGICW